MKDQEHIRISNLCSNRPRRGGKEERLPGLAQGVSRGPSNGSLCKVVLVNCKYQLSIE